jgi:hypothetical protein
MEERAKRRRSRGVSAVDKALSGRFTLKARSRRSSNSTRARLSNPSSRSSELSSVTCTAASCLESRINCCTMSSSSSVEGWAFGVTDMRCVERRLGESQRHRYMATTGQTIVTALPGRLVSGRSRTTRSLLASPPACRLVLYAGLRLCSTDYITIAYFTRSRRQRRKRLTNLIVNCKNAG